MTLRDKMASIVLRKRFERVFSPMGVRSIEDAKENAFATAGHGQSAHGTDAAAHFQQRVAR